MVKATNYRFKIKKIKFSYKRAYPIVFVREKLYIIGFIEKFLTHYESYMKKDKLKWLQMNNFKETREHMNNGYFKDKVLPLLSRSPNSVPIENLFTIIKQRIPKSRNLIELKHKTNVESEKFYTFEKNIEIRKKIAKS